MISLLLLPFFSISRPLSLTQVFLYSVYIIESTFHFYPQSPCLFTSSELQLHLKNPQTDTQIYYFLSLLSPLYLSFPYLALSISDCLALLKLFSISSLLSNPLPLLSIFLSFYQQRTGASSKKPTNRHPKLSLSFTFCAFGGWEEIESRLKQIKAVVDKQFLVARYCLVEFAIQ